MVILTCLPGFNQVIWTCTQIHQTQRIKKVSYGQEIACAEPSVDKEGGLFGDLQVEWMVGGLPEEAQREKRQSRGLIMRI